MGRSTTTASVLDITLLGRFAVRTTASREVRLVGRHAQALFALLALTLRPRTREAIATDLWPESLLAATGPLRQALYQLRSALTAAGLEVGAVLEGDAETLGLRREVVRSLDVDLFDACTDDPTRDPGRAFDLYGGDLAEGLNHECFAAERERLSDRFDDTLAILAQQCLDAGDLDRARRAAERLIGRDALREEGHAVLIAVHGLTGTRSQVVRQYRRICEVLSRELGEAPLPETDATYRIAIARTVAHSRRRAAQLERPTGTALVALG